MIGGGAGNAPSTTTTGTGVLTALGNTAGGASGFALLNSSGYLPVSQGGIGTGTAGIAAFNNITGYTASGATGTTSTNIVFSTSPTLVTPSLGVATGTSLALNGATIGTNSLAITGTAAISSTITSAGHIITSSSANALTAGLNGSTNPAFNVDASTSSSATGLNVKSAAAAGGLAISVLSSGTNENLTIDAKGSGTITFGGVSTGSIIYTRATTLSAALTYGGVTLSNSVTGTGSMVLSTSPTLTTPALGAATATSINVSGTISIGGNQAVDGPAFSAYQSSSQSVATNTATKVQIQTKEFDTNSCFDATTNYRFTPTVAGYYQISGAVNFASTTSGNSSVSIYKNGSEFKRFSQITSSILGINGSALIYFNGTTDYIELYCYQQSGSSVSTNASAVSTYFQGVMVRGA
jgi:hypothetical protein